MTYCNCPICFSYAAITNTFIETFRRICCVLCSSLAGQHSEQQTHASAQCCTHLHRQVHANSQVCQSKCRECLGLSACSNSKPCYKQAATRLGFYSSQPLHRHQQQSHTQVRNCTSETGSEPSLLPSAAMWVVHWSFYGIMIWPSGAERRPGTHVHRCIAGVQIKGRCTPTLRHPRTHHYGHVTIHEAIYGAGLGCSH
jgi:hypothetical protein